MAVSRRTLLRAASAAAALAAPMTLAADRPATAPAATLPAGLALPRAGQLRPRHARDIEASPLSVGFEVLDRRGFEPDKAYDAVGALGVKWARCQTGWARTEPEKGLHDFEWLDAVVDNLARRGVQPWFNVGYGNPLYTPTEDPAAVGFIPLNTDRAKAAWLAYAGALAAHFKGRVRHFEVWNEPNITHFWKPKEPDPAAYAAFVRDTAAVLRKAAPDAVIIGGALAGTPRDYLQKCLAAGLADSIDVLSYHPYRPHPERSYRDDVEGLRDALAEALKAKEGGPEKKTRKPIPLWQGECGCPSRKGSQGALSTQDWTELRQAKWLLRRTLLDLMLGVELTSYFHTVDLVGYRGGTNYKGLLHGTTYAPKLAYRAYQSCCALFDAQTRRQDLPWAVVPAPAGTRLATASFLRAGRPVFAFWAPADLFAGFKPLAADVTLTVRDAAAPTFERPVLIDPLDGSAYSPDARRTDRAWTFPRLPVLDHPLILADAAILG